MKAADHWIQRQ